MRTCWPHDQRLLVQDVSKGSTPNSKGKKGEKRKRQKAKGKRQKAKGKRQKAKGKRQKAKGKRQGQRQRKEQCERSHNSDRVDDDPISVNLHRSKLENHPG